jgi:hypothetical protein
MLYLHLIYNFTSVYGLFEIKTYETSKYYIDGDVFTIVFEKEEHDINDTKDSIQQFKFEENKFTYYSNYNYETITATGKIKSKSTMKTTYIAKEIDLSEQKK